MEEGPKKCQSMKLLVTWALKEFSAIDMYKCDPRMLDFWKLMVSLFQTTKTHFTLYCLILGQIQR